MDAELRRESGAQEGPPDGVDPDPFSIGLGIFSILASGVSFLEARRSRQFVEQGQRNAFAAAWFQSRRSLIYFKQAVDEFETYMLEDGYGRKAFRIGAVRLVVDRGRKQSLRRLHGQTMTTANHIADNLDDLSDFLGPEDQGRIDILTEALSNVVFPENYRALLTVARTAIGLYTDLLEDIGDRERFEADP